MRKITVYCGESIQSLCNSELHPINEVKRAIDLINSNVNVFCYSNNPDFVSAIKYIGESKGVEVEFFLNNVSTGNDIEKIFEDFNRSLDLIHINSN